MKKELLPKLTPPEFAIMNAVWTAPKATLSEIMNSVNSDREKKLQRTTIQVQVRRLEEKGWLTHSDVGHRFLFSATIPRCEASDAIIKDVRERIFGGSCVELVKSLFSGSDVSPEEVKKLRKLIDKYEEQ